MENDNKNIQQVCTFIDDCLYSDRTLLSAHIDNIKGRIRESLDMADDDCAALLKRL